VKKLLASILSLFGVGRTTAPTPSLQSFDPTSIRFTVPTISHDMAPLEEFAGRPEDVEFFLSEDDWTQIEFFAPSRVAEMQQVLRELRAFEAAHRANPGWRNVYARKLERLPILRGAQAVERLATILGSSVGAPPAIVSVGAIVGQISGGFSVPVGCNVVLYGYANDEGILVLGASVGENGDHKALTQAFAKLNASDGLLIVDWCQQMMLKGTGPGVKLDAWRP